MPCVYEKNNDAYNNYFLQDTVLNWKDPTYIRGSSIALTSGCELFLRFVTRQFLEIQVQNNLFHSYTIYYRNLQHVKRNWLNVVATLHNCHPNPA